MELPRFVDGDTNDDSFDYADDNDDDDENDDDEGDDDRSNG